MRIVSYEDVNNALFDIGKAESLIAKKEAEMNQKIQVIKDKYDNETIAEREAAADLRKRVEAFCKANKGDFMKTRSNPLVHGVIGFRNNPPKVIQLSKKWTVKSSLEFLKKLFNGKYIRAKEEMNKDQIMADYAAGIIDDSKLAAVGIRIDNDETFFIEINWDSLN